MSLYFTAASIIYGAILRIQCSKVSAGVLCRLVSDICGNDPVRFALADETVNAQTWLLSRIFQEDVFLMCDDKKQDFLLKKYGERVPGPTRRIFVAQIMNSGKASQKLKVKVYRQFRPYGENLGREKREDVRTQTRLLGHPAVVNGQHNGLTKRYESYDFTPDYNIAVCERLQRAYAESSYFRYQWCRNKLPGFKEIRCSFPLFAQMAGKWSSTCSTTEFESFCMNDNPSFFALMCDLNGVRIGLKQMAFLALHRCHPILAYLVRERGETIARVLSMEQLVFYVSALGFCDLAVPVIEAVEAVAPGTVANAVDYFGNTPIWYTLYALKTTNSEVGSPTWENERRSLVDCLARHGCDKYKKNHLGISYADLFDGH